MHCPWPSVHQHTLLAQDNVPHYLFRPVSLVESLGSPVCSFLVFMRQNPSRSGSKVEMNEPQVWRMEALHPSGQFIPVCGMNTHALVLFFLGACPFIYIGCVPNERMEYLLKYIQTLVAQQGNVVEKSHLALL